jgi:fructosamine-3-kinase
MDKALVAKGMGMVERLGGMFLDYRPPPACCTATCGQATPGLLADGTPVIFDPGLLPGRSGNRHRHGGSCSAAFRPASLRPTGTAWPLDRDYERRKPLYNLYHILNHYNLFGEAYLGQARRMIERLLADLRR